MRREPETYESLQKRIDWWDKPMTACLWFSMVCGVLAVICELISIIFY